MSSENDSKVVKKNGKGLIVALVFAIVVIIALVGYIYYDKILSSSNQTEKSSKLDSTIKNSTDKADESDNSNDNEKNSEVDYSVTYPANTRKCTGTYYGEASGTGNNGLSYDLRYTYTLKDDGTFELNAKDVSGTKGVYVIIGNTISLTGLKHTTGPEDVDPQYSTEDLVIAQDCSYILVNSGDGITFKATKK